MKSMKLLVWGVMVSLPAFAAFAQPPEPPHPNWPAARPAAALWPPPAPRMSGNSAHTAPRGDLRGDIVNNARSRGAAKHQNEPPQRR